MLPREEQAKLADFVTVANCSRPGWCRGAGLFGSGNFELWNVTSIGNLAYIALHATDEKERDQAEQHLKAAEAYFK